MADLEVTIPEELIQELFTSDRGTELPVEEGVNQGLEAEMADFLRARRYIRATETALEAAA